MELFSLVEIGRRLREVRRNLGENQTIFAKRGGVGLQTQSRYEAGDTEPGALYLSRLAESGVDVMYVLTASEAAQALHAIETKMVRTARRLSLDDHLMVNRLIESLAESFEARQARERRLENEQQSPEGERLLFEPSSSRSAPLKTLPDEDEPRHDSPKSGNGGTGSAVSGRRRKR